ncbi:MAG: BatD family protein [Candidatus Omnitrophota bacterium]|jgi:hypothetical protein
MKTGLIKFTICFVLLTVLAASVFAVDIKFEVSLDKDNVAIGETAQMGLSFHGTQSMPAPDIGNVDGLEIHYIGPSTMMTVINGQMSSSVTHMYSILPLKIGKFQLGPFSFKYKNNTYTSTMATLDVVAERPVNKEPAQESTVEKLNLEDRLFIVLDVGRKTAYVNELIPIKVKFYVNRLNVSDIQLPTFIQEGFSKIEFKEPKQFKEEYGGILYDVLEFSTNIFGTRPGDYRIGPAKIKCNLVVKKRPSRGSSTDQFFDENRSARDSFFDEFLTRVERHALELSSQDIQIAILPLPEEGRPKNFMGAVGDYQFIYSASPAKVKAGDPITVRMAINGSGNFNTVLIPMMENPDGFKVYEPEVKTTVNSKEFTQVLIPESDQLTQIPKAIFSYFDTNKKVYRTIVQEPIAIQVEKGKDELPSRVVGPVVQDNNPEERGELARDIVYIKESPGRWVPRGHDIYRGRVVPILAILPLIFLISLYFVRRQIDRIRTDTVYASRLNAVRSIKTGMGKLKHDLARSDQKVFYETLFEVLQNYLGNRLHIPPAGVTFDAIYEVLKDKDVEPDVVQKIKALFGACDESRFGFSSSEGMKMRGDVRQFEEIVKYLERKRL